MPNSNGSDGNGIGGNGKFRMVNEGLVRGLGQWIGLGGGWIRVWGEFAHPSFRGSCFHETKTGPSGRPMDILVEVTSTKAKRVKGAAQLSHLPSQIKQPQHPKRAGRKKTSRCRFSIDYAERQRVRKNSS